MNKKLPTWVAVPAVCVCSALLASGVNGATRDQINQQAAKSETAALASVVEAADRFDPVELKESRYTVDNVYAALNAAGEKVGYVGQTTVTGYGGPIEVTAGVDNDGVITGVNVGGKDFNETPGLGGLTREARFARQFAGKTAGVDLNDAENTEGVDGIAGATISSRAVLGGVNNIASYVSAAELGILEEQAEAYMGPTVSATEKGFAGDVTVTAGLADDGSIAYLDIQTPDETEGLGKLASEPEFTGQFIGKTGPFAYGEDGIEAITGASFTSTAVINALNTIVSGGGTASEGPLSTTVQGFGGDVTVNVMLNDDNSIAALSIDTPNETEGLGKRASEPEFTDQFIGKSAPFAYGEDGIEAITGASVTSTAVLGALNELVPGGEATPVAAPAEAPAEEAAEAPAEEAPAEEAAAETPAEETAAEEAPAEEAPAEAATVPAVAGTLESMLRARPADAALADAAVVSEAPADAADAETEAPVDAATAPAVAGTLESMLRARPADAALANAAATSNETPAEAAEAPVEDTAGEAAVGDVERMLRERPVEAEAPAEEAVEAETEAPAEVPAEAADGTAADRLMRPRPATVANN